MQMNVKWIPHHNGASISWISLFRNGTVTISNWLTKGAEILDVEKEGTIVFPGVLELDGWKLHYCLMCIGAFIFVTPVTIDHELSLQMIQFPGPLLHFHTREERLYPWGERLSSQTIGNAIGCFMIKVVQFTGKFHICCIHGYSHAFLTNDVHIRVVFHMYHLER